MTHDDASSDPLAFDSLAWAFSGQRRMGIEHHIEVKDAIRKAKPNAIKHRRVRVFGLGPKWGRMA